LVPSLAGVPIQDDLSNVALTAYVFLITSSSSLSLSLFLSPRQVKMNNLLTVMFFSVYYAIIYLQMMPFLPSIVIRFVSASHSKNQQI
jgi:hypothetical protein